MKAKCNVIKNEIREKITEVEEKHNTRLSTTQKILLSITEPITTVLDVLYGEVRLFMLDQHFENADRNIADLVGINEGDEIIYRNTVVFKHSQPLVYVVSYIPKDRCDDKILGDLIEGKLTTGKIIDKYAREIMRKINRISIEEPTPILTELFKTTEDMLSREYIILHNEEVIIWTKELYPLSYFKI